MININIIYEDRHLAVCVKPVGILSEEEGMPKLLQEELGGQFYCVHRLDQAVSGVMVYARTKSAAGKLTNLIASRDFEKVYLAVISGEMENKNGQLKDLLFKDSSKNKSYVVKRMRKGVKEAELEYTTLASREGTSLLKISLHSGRSHQIRVQFSSRKHPLLGDVKYGSSEKNCPLALFSHTLKFRHPFSGKEMIYSAIPGSSYPWNIYSDTLNEIKIVNSTNETR